MLPELVAYDVAQAQTADFAAVRHDRVRTVEKDHGWIGVRPSVAIDDPNGEWRGSLLTARGWDYAAWR